MSCQHSHGPVHVLQEINYESQGKQYSSFFAYDSSSLDKRPTILVLHEWWGMNDYTLSRTKQLAELGYNALAVDIYGNKQVGNNPQEASALSKPFYENPELVQQAVKSALAAVKQNPRVDQDQIAAIGYCFGGGMALNLARLGADMKAVVSFHGSLLGTPADANLLKAKILVCHGANDQFISMDEIETFKKQMDSIKADYKFVEYQGATHAFSNPDATRKGQEFNLPIAYNEAADTSSWNEMKLFFKSVFEPK